MTVDLYRTQKYTVSEECSVFIFMHLVRVVTTVVQTIKRVSLCELSKRSI